MSILEAETLDGYYNNTYENSNYEDKNRID